MTQKKIDIEQILKAILERPSAPLTEIGKQFGCTKQAVSRVLIKHNIHRTKCTVQTYKNAIADLKINNAKPSRVEDK